MDLERIMGWPEYTIVDGGTLMFKGRIYVPNNQELKRLILEEAHKSSFSIHP